MLSVPNGLFTLPDLDTDSNSDLESKPNGYVVLCRAFHTGWSRIRIPNLTEISGRAKREFEGTGK